MSIKQHNLLCQAYLTYLTDTLKLTLPFIKIDLNEHYENITKQYNQG